MCVRERVSEKERNIESERDGGVRDAVVCVCVVCVCVRERGREAVNLFSLRFHAKLGDCSN